MKSTVLRIIFAALLIAAAAGQISAFNAPKSNALLRLSQVLHDQGMSTSDTVNQTNARILSVMVPGCDLPVEISAMRLSLEEAPLLEAYLQPDQKGRYIFVGQTWSKAEPRAVRLAWLKHKVGPLLGGPFRTRLDTVLFVALPGNCPAAEKIDWLPLWSRE